MNKRFTLLLNVDHPIWGISSAGRAPALQAGGQEFEPPILQNYLKSLQGSFLVGLSVLGS